ncbi:flavin reductase family protein [Agrococcus jenensis]|uniref:Flavin reductase (DIM6/NTAB) family NADH-FMN oxidoreductase RutF n=1 Tax=Agrococcus jenensis TaxID=46353 RepID=A0A3N2AUS6_9MICO|nr:flavin reductase family protein [Agrococcus jenensis]ROR66705.1 flavin reductase (DIM6/NTAB) family NADH-FMN oxidoreductase RutF [Agrococcus jenensis]
MGRETPHQHAQSPTVEAVLDQHRYRAIFRQHAAAVAVVTLDGPTGPVGFTATSVISVSASPPVLAFSVAGTSSSWPALSTAETVVVNFLSADQADVSARFATPGIDRFADRGWDRLPTGEPVLHGVRARVRARVLDRIPAGSSFLVTLLGLDSDAPRRDARPLIYLDRTYPLLQSQGTDHPASAVD